MKKKRRITIMSGIVILAVIATCILCFVFIPWFKKSSDVVSHVAKELQIQKGDGILTDNDAKTRNTESIKSYSVIFKKTKYLSPKGSSSQKQKVHLGGYLLWMDSSQADYESVAAKVKKKQKKITAIICNDIQSYSKKNISSKKVKKSSLKKIRTYLKSNTVSYISFQNFNF